MLYYDQIGHLISDTSLEELHSFARMVGLKRVWFQKEGTRQAHYDLTTERMKKKARALGAVRISPKELVKILLKAPYNTERKGHTYE